MLKNDTCSLFNCGADAVAWLAAEAQTAWPTKTVRFIVPFARWRDETEPPTATSWRAAFGQQLWSRQGGVGGNIGTAELARATPDGDTIGLIRSRATR